MTDYLGLSNVSLDDAMIQYAYNGYGMVYIEHAWKEFKEFYNCQETPTELFDRFWDDIMPNLKNYEMIRNAPVIAESLSRIHNPRTYPPRPPRVHDNVKEISLFEFTKQQNEAMERKMFNDPKMLALKTHCLDYINKLRADPHTQPEKNQVPTNRGSLHIIDQSVLEQRVRPSSSDSPIGRMSRRVSQNPTSSSSLPGINQLTMERSIQQFSNHCQMSRGTQKRVSRDSTSQRSTSERSTADSIIVLDLTESTSESESETPRKRRRSADGE
ncbi:uncharacterized protein LOC119081912 isoform X2 [Bradysia coprophila]|uniref:uncharacterized protein LOC119081912 isoform X2 n=1 Tax=Bradysia coprophila TaxID=38358 RepID=UPI00187DB5D1|nr:uncharacterized protein LOC119081912 isoform X2 [Bradysia coprophila]